MKLQLLFIIYFLSSAKKSVQDFWDVATESPKSKPADYPYGTSWKKPVPSNPPILSSVFCIDGSGELFKKYLEQEKNLLLNRLQYISSLIFKSNHNPCSIYPIYPRQWIPDHRPDFPYIDYNQIINKNNIVDDKSSGKNLHIILNLTDFTENDMKFEIKDSRIMVEAQQDAEPHKYVKWSYLLPVGTNPSTITHKFDNGYMTIQGTLSEDVNSFSSQQILKTSIRHKTTSSFTRIRNYPKEQWHHTKK